MKILTAMEMGAVDRLTAEKFGVSLETLMEAAGGAVAKFCLRQYFATERVVVLCGKGNNGGDGFVAARVLAQAGVVGAGGFAGTSGGPEGGGRGGAAQAA